MDGYRSTKDTAKLWGISARRVGEYCIDGRIPGAELVGNTWLVPVDAEKPEDTRFREDFATSERAKPFVKWAGGKGQLLPEINQIIPPELGKTITKYAEPFVGGGAVLFDILSRYELDDVFISDVNRELIRTYIAIRDQPDDLIALLADYQKTVNELSMEARKEFYYGKREQFNKNIDEKGNWKALENASLFILLNKMCFNGLYRINSNGYFNVPCGRYKNPLICDESNIRRVSKVLQNVTIHNGNYLDCEAFVDEHTFVYFDPPYRPLSETSNFNTYAGEFNDDNQRDLAHFFNQLKEKGAYVALSNSDPKNVNPDDDFFDDLYKGNYISRVYANRMINANGSNRGEITELLITGYEPPKKAEPVQKTLND